MRARQISKDQNLFNKILELNVPSKMKYICRDGDKKLCHSHVTCLGRSCLIWSLIKSQMKFQGFSFFFFCSQVFNI